jgi:hypothetical protein
VWVVDAENDEVLLVSDDGGRRRFAVGRWPEQLLVDRSGRVFVSCRGAGWLEIIDRGFERGITRVGPEPRSLALDSTTRRLYVGLVTTRTLAVVDADSADVLETRQLPAQPDLLALTGHGDLAILPRQGGHLFVADAELRNVLDVPLPSDGHKSWNGQALATDGDALIVAYALVDPVGHRARRIETRFRGGGTYGTPHTPDAVGPIAFQLAEVQVSAARRTASVLPAGSPLGVGDFTGAVVMGSDLLLASRSAGLLLRVTLPNRGWLGDEKPMQVLLRDADGIAGVAVGPDRRLYALAAFDRKLVVVDNGHQRRRIDLGPGQLDAELQRGRRLFYSQNQRVAGGAFTCAACHPDGREDGLVWTLDGEKLQTPLLAGRLVGMEPYNWHGSAGTLEESLRNTVDRLGGLGVDFSDLSALARYLREGLPEPSRLEPPDVVLALEGAQLFNSDDVGCARCHPSDLGLTDGAGHVLDSAKPEELFDTPSLRFVGLTPPYLHDGSVSTLSEWVEKNHDKMGKTDQLTRHQRRALVAFLQAL